MTPGCREFHVQRNKERIAKHIFRDCHRVSKELRDLASKYFQDIAPSKKLREMEEAAKVITQSEVNSGVVRAVKTSKQVTEDAKTLNSADEDKGMNF